MRNWKVFVILTEVLKLHKIVTQKKQNEEGQLTQFRWEEGWAAYCIFSAALLL